MIDNLDKRFIHDEPTDGNPFLAAVLVAGGIVGAALLIAGVLLYQGW